MQDQINELNNKIDELTQELSNCKSKIMQLENNLNINSSPEFVKQLLNVVKPQIVVTSILVLPDNQPTGTLAMQVSPAKLAFKSDTGWVTLI